MQGPVLKRRPQSGFSIIEVLISMVVLSFGLLALAGMMIQSQRSEMESYQRSQALLLLNEMYERINANRPAAPCYVITTNTVPTSPTAGSPFAGTASAAFPACVAVGPTATQIAQVVVDLNAWDARLKGVAERTAGAADIGAMVGARGCISYAAGTELTDTTPFANVLPGTGIYTITVAWQGLGPTAAPAAPCGNNEYGDETTRRTVSLTFRIGAINNTL
ncbi:type IV pilus modification protein PilV [Ramlibacter sp. AN1015]|uniref:type IV pilus modification protein PilV n=1 Tax=Ramlibacter sp. AN1015 TaxID=3133428 RepID=UPI0030BF04A1